MYSITSKIFLITFILYSPLFLSYVDEITDVPPLAFFCGILLFYAMFNLFLSHFRDPRSTQVYAFKKLQIEGYRMSPSLIFWVAVMYCCAQLTLISGLLIKQTLILDLSSHFFNVNVLKLLVPLILISVVALVEWNLFRSRIKIGWPFKLVIGVTAIFWVINFFSTAQFMPVPYSPEYTKDSFFSVIQILFITFGNWIIITMCIENDNSFAKFDAAKKATRFTIILIVFVYILDYLFSYTHLASQTLFVNLVLITNFFLYYKILVELAHNAQLVKIVKRVKRIERRYLVVGLATTFFLIAYVFNLTFEDISVWSQLFLVMLWGIIAVSSKPTTKLELARVTVLITLLATIFLHEQYSIQSEMHGIIVWFIIIFVFYCIYRRNVYDPKVEYHNAFYFYDVHGSVLTFSKFGKNYETSEELLILGEKYTYEKMKKKFNLPEHKARKTKQTIYLSCDKLKHIHYTSHHIHFKIERPKLETAFFKDAYWHDTKNILEFEYNKIG